jgi:fructose/tagatose bisphosphate aldolase
LHELRNILRQAQNDGVSVGHSNVADLVLMKAVSAAAREVRVPVACDEVLAARVQFQLRARPLFIQHDDRSSH